MKRVPLSDGSGCWFDKDKAVEFDEDAWHDGRNFISRATGSQWHHQALYYTKSGIWILHSWSQYQGSGESYEEMDAFDAVRWLINNRKWESLEELPEGVRLSIQNEIAGQEV